MRKKTISKKKKMRLMKTSCLIREEDRQRLFLQEDAKEIADCLRQLTTQRDIGQMKKISYSKKQLKAMEGKIGKKLLRLFLEERMFSAFTDGKRFWILDL